MVVKSPSRKQRKETVSPIEKKPIDKEAERILRSFHEIAEANDIWFTIDASGLTSEFPAAGFYEILQASLDTAKTTCIRTVPPLQRYINFKSKRVANEVFIKIQYSRDGAHIPEENEGFKVLKMMIKDAGGYLKFKNADSLGSINIVLPSW